MTTIVIGTTPTITYTFKVVPVSSIVTAILTIKQRTGIVIKKTLADGTIGENSLSWDLSQEETLLLGVREGTVMLNWVTADGKRGIGAKQSIICEDNDIREVI
jgi:hypothetical protein